MPTALITGVLGQDGGYLAELLTGQGVTVHGIDVETPADRAARGLVEPWLDGVEVHTVDLVDTDAVARLVDEVEPDEIYNLAAISSVAVSWERPVLTSRVNAVSVAGMLEAAHSLGERVGKRVSFVQASSAEIFGAADHAPQTERTPIRPVNPYGASKAYAHHLVDVYRRRGLHASAAIFYGHESVRRPPTFVTRKISSTVAAIAAGRVDRLVLGSLEARRDWGWAPEYVQALTLLARHDTADDVILATGRAHSIEEFVAACFQRVGITDWRPLVHTDPAFIRPAEAGLQVGDPSHAAQLLGWRPGVVFPEVAQRMVDADVAALG